ncbi:acetyl-CoA carboxylase biotin carboxylase subunit family protein [Mesorhizobium sp. M0621]|uniref:ATP-grasp domain-containing protein n=1 Tax=Mesorhizobium sp. M0621 TaxID=2956974 RepID=UPI0033383A5B
MVERALIMLEGTTNSNSLLFVRAAKYLGLHPIALATDPGSYDYIAAERVQAVRVDTEDFNALVRECYRLREMYEVAGITSALERVYATVGKLCRHFDLPGPNPTSIERCCDKFSQRRLLAEAGIPIPAFRLAANPAEVESAASDLGLPVILKPAVGSGSSGVRLCRTTDEITQHSTFLLSGEHIWQSSPRILVEEFAQGPYYTAEVMGNEVVAIGTGDFGPPPHFVCRGFTYPAPLTDGEHNHIADVSLECLRALNLGWGPTNVELRLTSRGPIVIEVNPRLAGMPFPQLVHLAYGVDLITEHIKHVIGKEWDLRRRHSRTAVARHLVADRDGTLDWIVGHSEAAAVLGVAEVKVYVKPKTPIIRKGDFDDCIGHVIAASPSLTEAENALQHAIDLITWSITPFSPLGEHGPAWP